MTHIKEKEIIELYKTEGLKNIKKTLKIGQKTIYAILKENNIPLNPKNIKYQHNNEFFKIINTEEKAYWLGFMYADGNVGKNCNLISITCQLKDTTHINKFKNTICEKININQYKHTYGVYSVFQFYSKKIKEDLIKLGCVPAKSLILKFPTEEQVPKDLQRHFIRGYFDGDGSVFMNTRDNKLSSSFIGTENFIKTLQLLLHHEININITKIKNNGKIEGITKFISIQGNKNCHKLYNYLYDNSSLFLKRKKEKFEEGFRKSINNYEILPSLK